MKTIEGWLIKYGKPSSPLKLPSGKTVTEIIAPGAFTDSVNLITAGTKQIECNIEHVDDAISRIGLSGKNVKIENRAEGVYATISLTDDTLSNDIFAKTQAGIVSGLSVEFEKIPGFDPTYTPDGSGNYVRTFNKAILKGFAICATPAYPDAQIVSSVETVNHRSLSTAEIDSIAADINKIESVESDRIRSYYERQKVLLGIS